MITYEWIAETLDGEDIVDTRSADTLDELQPEPCERVGLCKNVGDQDNGISHRAWAYLQNGALPESFDDGSKVPKRHKPRDRNKNPVTRRITQRKGQYD